MNSQILSIIIPTIFAVFSSEAQVVLDTCFVFKNGSYTGTQVPKNQFFSIVHSEASYPGCSYGSVVGTNEGRFYAKKEDGQTHRLGGETVSEYEAQSLASQNNVTFYNCAKIVCGQNQVNTNPGLVEPEDTIAQKAQAVGQAAAMIVMQNNLQDYFKFISYAHQVKMMVSGLSEQYLQQQAVNTSNYQGGYKDGLNKCTTSCFNEGESLGERSANYQASNIVDQKVDAGFIALKKPNFEPIVIPPQSEQLASLSAHRAYSERPSDYWSEASNVYSNKLSSVSGCGSYSCNSYGGFSVSTDSSIGSLSSLLSSSRNLLDYNNEVSVDRVFDLFESRSLNGSIPDPSVYEYLSKITNSSYFQNSYENKNIFKKYFLAATTETIRNQWANEVNKYTNYHPVQGHVSEMIQVMVNNLGYSIGFNNGYAEKFLIPAQEGYKKVFDSSFKNSYRARISYYENNPVFTDVKIAVSNNKGTDKYGAYDDVFLTLKGLTNKGFIEGEITCSLNSSNPKVQALQNKKFKIPAFTKTDKDVPLGILGTVKGEKFTTPNESIDFRVDCGRAYFNARVESTWTETVIRMAQETRPEYSKAYLTFVTFHLNSAYQQKFKSYKQQDTAFDKLAQELVATYKGLSSAEKARLDAQKDNIVKTAFGEEPKKKLLSKNEGYKLYQVMRGYFSPIGWVTPPKK